MNPELKLSLNQQLKLSPQLQQSLKLLQLSQLELVQEIQFQLESNPLLESQDNLEPEQKTELSETSYTASNPTSNKSNSQLDEHYWESVPDQADLKESLEHQLQLHNLSRIDLEIGYYIIENLNDEGFLTVTENQISAQILRDTEHKVTEPEIIAIKHLIQSLEPSGCACKDLQEFLQFQLETNQTFNREMFENNVMQNLITEHFQLLINQQYSKIETRLGISTAETKTLLDTLQKLRQRPNDYKVDSVNNYIQPDVKISRSNGQWQAQVIQSNKPSLSVNKEYAQLLKTSSDPKEQKYIKTKASEAQQFINALNARHSTLQKVANYLLEHQIEYFEQGDIALKPLKLNDLAEYLELHESTISRATSNKYCQTPNGVIPMKSLFSNAVNTTSGGDWSQTAVKSQIKQLILEERAFKPLSDNKIVQLLADKNIKIARRTVTKYREALQIPSATKRKQLALLQ